MASRVCVCPPKVPFCQIFSGGGSAGARERGSLEERAGRRAPGVNWGGGADTGDCGGQAASRREPEFLEGGAGSVARVWASAVARPPRGDLGGGAVRRGGRARSSMGVCGGRENPFVADRSLSGLRRGGGGALPPLALAAAAAAEGQVHPPTDPSGSLLRPRRPRRRQGRLWFARKVRAARVSHPPRSLSPPAPQLSLLLMQNLGRGWGRPQRQCPGLECAKRQRLGRLDVSSQTPTPSDTLGGLVD